MKISNYDSGKREEKMDARHKAFAVISYMQRLLQRLNDQKSTQRKRKRKMHRVMSKLDGGRKVKDLDVVKSDNECQGRESYLVSDRSLRQYLLPDMTMSDHCERIELKVFTTNLLKI